MPGASLMLSAGRGSRQWPQMLSDGKEKAGGGTRGWLNASRGETSSRSPYNVAVTELWVPVMDLGVAVGSRSSLEGGE